ncbi:Helix-turn-helix domain-containing protein [Soonwooa buanensis]|uniref:Helix-turn-helix domain-containing protein n=1 Tax=Soonwooa buanensis TaxID=619805 RepID=A0A1T5GCH5_9FLAO|nr:helix-turn-helix transcriptional regulator [Soonwooa buanensis]SKC06031.1 Helix-turn-helix domain-containing protein [Soonwooa buanensis]
MHTTLFFTCLILAILVGILTGIIATYYYLVKKKKDQNPLIFTTFNDETPPNVKLEEKTSANISPEILSEERNEDQELMTVETRVKIIQKLEKFEKSGLFTNRNLSLPYLAAYLETNTKYLSKIIKNYKHSDFNAYINKLRIDYILKQLNENKEYRHYKISSLAEEAGYSSHSKFATIFKQVVGIPPSLYIQHLEIGKIPRDIPNMNIDNNIAVSS